MGRYIKQRADAFKLPLTTEAAKPVSPDEGTTFLNTTTGAIEYYNGAAYEDVSPAGNVPITSDTFAGDNVTTDFTMSKTPTSAAAIIVSVSNVIQVATTNYTVAGTTITFLTPPPAAAPISVVHGFDSNSTI